MIQEKSQAMLSKVSSSFHVRRRMAREYTRAKKKTVARSPSVTAMAIRTPERDASETGVMLRIGWVGVMLSIAVKWDCAPRPVRDRQDCCWVEERSERFTLLCNWRT